MKITGFNPQIITKDAESVVRLFEELGFEKRHHLKDVGEQRDEGIRMKNGDGFYLDVALTSFQIPHDLVAIRMNVDDFDEAYELLTARGFKNFFGDKTVEMESNRSALMISPSGYAFNLVQHIK